MSPFSPAVHDRVAAPVTPNLSPQHSVHSLRSTASARSYTPIHPLLLHEYRKQQSSPRTPEPPVPRRLKRKAAAARLNASERAPLLHHHHRHHPPQLPPSPPSTSHSEPYRHEPSESFAGLHVSSFRSLPALQQRPSLGLRDIARLNASSVDLPPLNAPHARALPRDFGLGSRKRLPRPKDIEIRRPLATPPPLPTEPSSVDLLETAARASSSTFTLSNFPFPEPPRARQAAQAVPPLNVWPRDSHPAPTPSLLDTPPATPALLHFRGTSFDVVNPHNSLYSSNLESPAAQDECNDYFHRTSLDQLLPADMASPSDADDDAAAKQPPRPLFDDLRSAHASIAKSTPRSGGSAPRDHAEAILSSAAPVAHASDKPDRRTSIMNRARTVFKRKENKPAQFGDALRSIPYGSTYTADPAPATDTPGSSATIMPSHTGAGAGRPSGDTWETISESAGLQYDQVSMYPDTEFDSSSLYGPINNRRSLPFGVKNQITDYSGELSYEFDYTPRHSVHTNLSRSASVDSRGARTLSRNIDNTLGNIYDQYGGSNPFNANVSTEGLMAPKDEEVDDDDDDTIRVPSLRSILPASPPSKRISGLSKFDFGLDDVRSTGYPDSNLPSPLSPRDGAFARSLAMACASPGEPPNFPPPAPGEVGEARRVYAHASDDCSNRASSYGDTRKLLGISGTMDATNRMSVITEGSRFSEGDKLPQSPLQEFIEKYDSQSGTPDAENHRYRTQKGLLSSETNTSMDSDSVGEMTFQMAANENAAPVHSEIGLRRQATVSNAERKSNGSDIPAMWRHSISPGPRNESPATLATEGTDGDWETLAPTMTPGDQTRRSSLEPALPPRDIPLPRRSNTNPWRQPRLVDEEGGGSMANDIPRFPRDSQLSFLKHGRLGKNRLSAMSSTASASSRPYELSAAQVKDLLPYGPGEEVIEEYEMSPLPSRPRRSALQEPSTPMDSSPRANSFGKLTLHRPEGNVTGTPMGTGMRYAGSSTAGSSPPANIRAYREIFTGTPTSTASSARHELLGRPGHAEYYSPTGGRMVHATPSNPFSTPLSHKPSPLARESMVSSQSIMALPLRSYGKEIDSLRAAASNRAERVRRMKSASVGSSINGSPLSRASVRGMTSPFPLTLRYNERPVVRSDSAEVGTVAGMDAHGTAQTRSRTSPHLHQAPQQDSSIFVDRNKKKKRLSWIIFAICGWFPPTAMLMFMGAFDGLMFYMSGGEIARVARFHKRCAIFAFIAEASLVTLFMALWLARVI